MSEEWMPRCRKSSNEVDLVYARGAGQKKGSRCFVQSTGNGVNNRFNITSGPCFPSRIASTMSGASRVPNFDS